MYVAPDSGALIVSGSSKVDTFGGLLITLYAVLRTPSNFRFDARGTALGMTMSYVEGCRN